MALQQPVGFLDDRSWGFLHLKVSDVAQRLPIHPFSNTLEKMEKLGSCELLYLKKKEGLRLGQEAIIEAPKPICWIKTAVTGSLLARNDKRSSGFSLMLALLLLEMMDRSRHWMQHVVHGTFGGGHGTFCHQVFLSEVATFDLTL